jgi:hypothetical protein
MTVVQGLAVNGLQFAVGGGQLAVCCGFIILGPRNGWDPPSLSDSTELAECPAARQALWD